MKIAEKLDPDTMQVFLKDFLGNNPLDINSGSDKKYNFICNGCGFKYNQSISNWVRKKRKLGICYHKKSELFFEKHPERLAEFNFHLNKIDPYSISSRSGLKIHFQCIKCKSNYSNVAYSLAKCPYCSNSKVNETNCLLYKYPELSKFIISPDCSSVVPGSHMKCRIICRKCNHKFDSIIYNIVNAYKAGNTGCPYCHGIKINEKNNLLAKHPELCSEWDYSRNKLGPENYTPSSQNKVYLKCSHGHIRYKPVSTIGISGCPKCKKIISKAETEWLDYLNIPAKFRNKLLKINNKRYYPDAVVNNKIYEFNGDYYHGNPEIFDLDAINKKTGTTFRELYYKTLEKIKTFKEAGYEVISIWENDWVKFKNINSLLS